MTRAAAELIPVSGPTVRPMRADARRNRERILKAARAVFADAGLDAQIDDVARRAKVGVGTVYRHFPTKEALLDALVRERFGQIAQIAEEMLERGGDPWEGFHDLIWRAAELNAADRGFCEAVASDDQRVVVEESGLLAKMDVLMARAKAAGQMRGDATNDDVAIMMCGCGSVMRTMPMADAWRRYLTVMLDGLRAS
jgi:AcrR family transcriptional regulator